MGIKEFIKKYGIFDACKILEISYSTCDRYNKFGVPKCKKERVEKKIKDFKSADKK